MLKVKGINDSLVIFFEKGSFEEYKSLLGERIVANKQLFTGSRVIFRGEGLQNLSHNELIELQRLCLDNGMILNNTPARNDAVDKTTSPTRRLNSTDAPKKPDPPLSNYNKQGLNHT